MKQMLIAAAAVLWLAGTVGANEATAPSWQFADTQQVITNLLEDQAARPAAPEAAPVAGELGW
jgi:hypothetical protein